MPPRRRFEAATSPIMRAMLHLHQQRYLGHLLEKSGPSPLACIEAISRCTDNRITRIGPLRSLSAVLRASLRRQTREVLIAPDIPAKRPGILGVAPGQWRDRERLVRIGVNLLGKHTALKGVRLYPLQPWQSMFEFVNSRRTLDLEFGQPAGADEPRISRNIRNILADLMVIVVLIARNTADLRFDDQPIFHRLHRSLDPVIPYIEHAELVET